MADNATITVSQALSSTVVSKDGRELGTVTDVLIDLRDDRAAYVLIKPTGSDQTVPIRFSALAVNSELGGFVLDSTPSKLAVSAVA